MLECKQVDNFFLKNGIGVMLYAEIKSIFRYVGH